MIVTFCGHKDVFEKEQLKQRVQQVIEQLIGEGATLFLLGGYGGFDSMAAVAVKEADDLYDDGSASLIALIEDPWFSNNIGHSVHSYISITLKYFKKRGYIIDRSEVLTMYKYLVQSSKQNYDKWMKYCRENLFAYCKQYYPADAAMFDQEAFKAFKKENYIQPV